MARGYPTDLRTTGEREGAAKAPGRRRQMYKNTDMTPLLLQWMGYAVFVVAMATLVATPRLLVRKGAMNNIESVVTVAIAASIAIAILITVATKPFRRSIPHRFKKIRDLIPFVATSNSINWTRDLVAKVVKDTVIEQLGLDEKRYFESARFVEDLGLDQ